MKNNIFFKLISIIFYVFATYWFLLFLYDLYFYKHFYTKFCSFIYCLEYIEFKDYASILATLIGSAFVAYSLFSWKDIYILGLEKKDLESFRDVLHEKMQNIEIIYGSFADQYTYINDCIINKNLSISSFNETIQDYKSVKEDLKNLRIDLLKTNNKFRLHRKYFIIYGGYLDQKKFDEEFMHFVLIQDKIMNSMEDDNVQFFLNNFIDYENKYKFMNTILNEILKNNIKLLKR